MEEVHCGICETGILHSYLQHLLAAMELCTFSLTEVDMLHDLIVERVSDLLCLTLLDAFINHCLQAGLEVVTQLVDVGFMTGIDRVNTYMLEKYFG